MNIEAYDIDSLRKLVLYIQSEENYLKICYLENGELKFCILRSSMKRVEDLCSGHGLVRCHRSYFINKHRVKALQKEKDYTYAVLDVVNANAQWLSVCRVL